MKSKNSRISWGNGCWAECAKLTKEKRASGTPYRNWINGAILYHGQVFGRDEVGYFILRNIVYEAGKGHGASGTIMLYRLNTQRGWVPSWECNATTAQARFLYRNNNKTAICTVENEHLPRNRCAEVHRASTSVIIK